MGSNLCSIIKIFISSLAKGRISLTLGKFCIYYLFRLLAGGGVLAR